MSRTVRDSSEDGSSEDDDGDYIQNKKKHVKKRRGGKKRTARDFELPRVSSRNGKALPNYNEAEMFSDLSDSDDGYEYEYTEEQGEFLTSLRLVGRRLTLTTP